MSQQNDSGFISVVAGAVRGANLRVYNSSGTWTTADATHGGVGVQQQPSVATTDIVTLKAISAPGTVKMVASGVIAVGATVYAAADGEIADSGTIIEGIALEAAGADQDVIEVIPIHNRDVSTATTGTTAAAFEVDSDASTPKIALAGQTAGTGNFTTTLKPEAALAADTYVILPETTDGDTLVSLAATQTLTNKTLTAPTITTPTVTSPAISGTVRFGHTVTPVAAAGSTVADAAALGDSTITHITSDGAAKGVKLPAVTAAGVVRIVVNNSATAAELYAESTGTVNGLAADASVVVAASKGLICISTAAKTWIAFDLTALATTS
jgi:hypothetical protein